VEVAFRNASQEIRKALRPSGGWSQSDFPIHDRQIHLSVLLEPNFFRKGLGNPYRKAMPPSLNLGTHNHRLLRSLRLYKEDTSST